MSRNNNRHCFGCRASVDSDQTTCHVYGQSLSSSYTLLVSQPTANVIEKLVIGEGTPYEQTFTITDSPYQARIDRLLISLAKEVLALKEEIKTLKDNSGK